MVQAQFGGSGFAATPFSALKNLPSFLVRVPITKDINATAYACAFDSGLIHAYGFRSSAWNAPKNNTDPGVV